MAKKKEYYIPTIEVTILSSNLMQLADTSGHISGGSSGAPMRREKAF